MAISFSPGSVNKPKAPVVCHPESQCDVCKKPETSTPQDTFTPSSKESGALGMADPSKYPDKKPAPFPFIGTPMQRPLFFQSPLLKP